MVIILCILIAACGRDGRTGGYDGIFEKLSRARGYAQVKRFYTKGTTAVLDEAAARGLIAPEARLRMLPLFSEHTKWIEDEKRISGRHGRVRIRYTAHPVENMIGCAIELHLVRDGEDWKIDLEDDLRRALNRDAGGAVPDYLNAVKKGYQ